MKVKEKGCALCGSTWGNTWREVDGQRMFFCCEVCASEFSSIVAEVKRTTGWKTIDEIEMRGDQRGRACRALNGAKSYEFFASFDEEGKLFRFLETGVLSG
jgi:hypothetical protein